MAVNVYLTFYYKFDAVSLRRMEIPYLILCYGVPMIPALVFVFVKDSNGTRVYGNALLWCWISLEWDIWRIASFYGPVWLVKLGCSTSRIELTRIRVVIIVTFFIYIRAGRTIYERRKQLQGFQSSDLDPLTFNGDLIFPIKTTEVIVTSEPASSANAAMKFEPLTTISALQPRMSSDNRAYSIHVTSNSATSTHSNDDAGFPIQGHADDAEAMPQPISNFSTRPKQQRVARAVNHTRRRNHELNNAAWSYTKCAILFFTAILITWIPSSANRVFSVIHKGEVSVVLGFMSAFVLPLQGFWNAAIYAVTSWSACKNLWHDLHSGRRAPDATELVGGMPPASSQSGQSQHHSDSQMSTEQNRKPNNVFQSASNSRRSKPFDTESAKELSTSRSTSADGRY